MKSEKQQLAEILHSLVRHLPVRQEEKDALHHRINGLVEPEPQPKSEAKST
jgi:hypothetical protein